MTDREKYLTRKRRYNLAHREERHQYYQDNKERIKVVQRAWRDAHPGYKNPEKNRACVARWQQANPEKVNEKSRRWRARRKGKLDGRE